MVGLKQSTDRHKDYARLRASIVSKLGSQFVGLDAEILHIAHLGAMFVSRKTLSEGHRAPRILLTGPVSSGKTTLAASFAKAIGAQTVHLNCVSLTPAPFRGVNLPDALSNFKETRAPRVLILCEIDKLLLLAKNEGYQTHAMMSLLPLLGGETITFETDTGVRSVDTGSMFVIATGAFTNVKNKCAFKGIIHTASTLLKLGFPLEFVSRITDSVSLQKLSDNDLLAALKQKIEKSTEGIAHLKSLQSDNLARSVFMMMKNVPFGFRFSEALISELIRAKLTKH